MRTLALLFALLIIVSGCTHNITKLDEDVYARTSDTSTGKINPDGTLLASYHGIGATQLVQDSTGNWTNMPGPVGVISVPITNADPNGEDGVGYIVSPKNVKIQKMSYTPVPAPGDPAFVIEGLEANVSEPLGQHVAALQIALPVLQAMTKEEALATIEKWRIAKDIVPTVADLLVQIVSAW